MADTRVFRITYGDGSVRYGNRRKASNAAAYAKGESPSWWNKANVFEATNAEATAGWTDVTDEFLGGSDGQAADR